LNKKSIRRRPVWI